ncbi:MAG: Ger(x)C family spore germination protein [Bacteroidota bacterium]
MIAGRRFLPALLAGLLLLPSSGCWDREELENLALVMALGFDFLPGGRCEVTAQIAIPTRLGAGGGAGRDGGGGDGGPPTVVLTKSGSTMYDAFRAINRVINRQLTFTQARLLFFGDRTARQGVKNLLAGITRFREFRRTMYVMVVKGRAKDVLSIRSEIERNPAEYLLDLATLARYSGETDLATVNEFIRAMESRGSSPVATYLLPPPKRKDEKKAQGQEGGEKEGGGGQEAAVTVGGVAVFRGDRLAGVIDPIDVPAYLMLKGRFIQSYLSLSDPLARRGKIVLQLTSGTPKVTPHLRGSRPAAEVDVKVEADLASGETGLNYMDEPHEHRVEKVAAAHLNRLLRRVIRQAQSEFRSDPFGLGDNFRPLVPDWPAWTSLRMEEQFPSMPIKISVRVYLRRLGSQQLAPTAARG